MNQLRILTVHNYYQQSGGEDNVFKSEQELLRSYGHELFEYVDTNDRLNNLHPITAARETVWSKSSYENITRIISEKKPDIAHFHNTFLLISPSAYYACYEKGVPVVQTLHNYRLCCLSAVLYRHESVCENCLRKYVAWPGVLHKCYHQSSMQSFIVAYMLTYHRIRKTWSDKVSAYIALTEFLQKKMIQAGLPAKKVHIKPNFVNQSIEKKVTLGEYVLFVGRLVNEKGIITLLDAWSRIEGIPLVIAGDGPLKKEVEQYAATLGEVRYLGYRDHSSTISLMQNARYLVFPSEWYEGFPISIVESFACGLPVVASRLGSIAELVLDGMTGLLFEPGNKNDLAKKVAWLWNHTEEVARMGSNARKIYEEKYTPELNYQMLMEIYSKVLENKS